MTRGMKAVPFDRACVLLIAIAFLVLTLGRGASAATSTFHYDDNMSGTGPGFPLSYDRDTCSHGGLAHWVEDYRALPCAGRGNMRLTHDDFSNDRFACAQMLFGLPVTDITLCAVQYDNQLDVPVTTPFEFIALDEAGRELGTFSVAPSTAWPVEYTQLHFASAAGIRKIRLLGITNGSMWDEMTLQFDAVVATKPKTWGRLKMLYR